MLSLSILETPQYYIQCIAQFPFGIQISNDCIYFFYTNTLGLTTNHHPQPHYSPFSPWSHPPPPPLTQTYGIHWTMLYNYIKVSSLLGLEVEKKVPRRRKRKNSPSHWCQMEKSLVLISLFFKFFFPEAHPKNTKKKKKKGIETKQQRNPQGGKYSPSAAHTTTK